MGVVDKAISETERALAGYVKEYVRRQVAAARDKVQEYGDRCVAGLPGVASYHTSRLRVYCWPCGVLLQQRRSCVECMCARLCARMGMCFAASVHAYNCASTGIGGTASPEPRHCALQFAYSVCQCEYVHWLA